MKKVIFLIAAVLMTAATASAVRYKGYGEITGGAYIPNDYYGVGGLYGISTSHGVEIIDGLFVGGGIEGNVMQFAYPGSSSYNVDELDYSGNFAVFAECRYNFLRTKKVSPFVGTRFGGGFDGLLDEGCFYFSPAVGVTINLTKRFGLDASLAYSLWNGSSAYEYQYPYKIVVSHGVAVRFGVHF